MVKVTDAIDDLPLSEMGEDEKDVQELRKLAKTRQKRKMMVMSAKEVLYATVLFILFSLPVTDKLIQMVVPATDESYMVRYSIKAVLFFLVLYVITYKK